MKAERKYLAHYLDSSFGAAQTAYVRLGKDLEEYYEELNPDVEVKENIIGEQSVDHAGYEVNSDTDPFYYEYDDALSEKVMDIAMNRKKGDVCKTSKVDVLLKDDGTVLKAWREDVYIVPKSVGGGTTGIQVPFTIYNAGNRVQGTFDFDTKEFTAGTSTQP